MNLSPVQKSFLFVFLIASLFVPSVGHTQTADDENQRVIQAFAEALKTENPQTVKAAWMELNDHPEAIGLMQKNMPKLHYLFQVRGLYFQLEDVQADHAEALSGPYDAASPDQTLQNFKRDLSIQTPESVPDFSVSDEQVRRSNRDRALQYQGITRRDNREIALANPNQNRRPNQDVIESRLEGRRNQKFQEFPQELVPAALSQEGSGEGPAVTVQGMSTQITLWYPGIEQKYIDLYLNNQPIEQNFSLTKEKKLVTLHLDPGANTLKIHLNESSGTAAASAGLTTAVMLGFDEILKGDRRFTWVLKAGDTEELTIASVP